MDLSVEWMRHGIANWIAFWGINTLLFNPILSVVLIAIIVFSVSFAISYIFNHIPHANRYVV